MDAKSVYAANKPQSSGDGLFLKLKDGDNVRLRVLGLPAVFDSEYEGKVSTKYSWPVYNHDEEKVQVFQGGATIYNALNALVQDEDWGDPVEYDIKVSRTGKGTDTKYSVSPSPKSKEVPDDIEQIDVVAITASSPFASNVRRLGEKKDEAPEDVDGAISLDEIPFD